MKKILLIETSTLRCSVALCNGSDIMSFRESNIPKAHASLTAVFAQEVLDECGYKASDLDAVCVSMGPGSYTGLRVGVSTAKGICFGAKVPLLAVGTTDTLTAQAIQENILPDGCRYIIPMIDARRMEVYSGVFSSEGKRLVNDSPVVVDGNSYAEYINEGPVLFIGDGALKCADILGNPNSHFVQCEPDARSMASLAQSELEAGNFKDVAYFEPFYLKEFSATVSKKKLF